jgi:hypothetical protein
MQSQTPKPQNALEMSKQHLNAFSVTLVGDICLTIPETRFLLGLAIE